MKCRKDVLKYFHDYYKPLSYLETAFQLCEQDIEFHLCVTSTKARFVEIKKLCKRVNSIFIEGDSPTQAIKDVAEAVRL